MYAPPSPTCLTDPTTCFLSPVIAGSLPLRWCESNDPGVATGLFALRLPRFLLTLYAWFHRHVLRDPVYASLVEGWRVKDGQELYALVAQREDYRAEWFEYWQREKLDLVLTVPNALPAIRHGDIRRTWKACGYTFLFNIVCANPTSSIRRILSDFSVARQLDYSAGVMPVTRVDGTLDKLSRTFRPRNKIEKDAYAGYDADGMHGLPVGVQIVGRRLEEEKVLEGMKLIEGILKNKGIAYTHMLE